jgi:glucans biosynthesis protein C
MPAQNTKSSQALSNLRAAVILVVVAFHSALAYLGSQPAAAFAFDDPPYKWRAFPILDNHRWFGFDIFCAWQDVYLMSLMFFLSALFTWPGLRRKGSTKFLADRFLRLGLPFVFALTVVAPVAIYPAYRVTATDPGVMAYARHLLALPFWPNGPMWFLWQLLALTIVASGLHRFAPRSVEALGRAASAAGTNPGRYFTGLVAAAALAYIPMAVIFTPWAWAGHGPFALQFSRPLLYAVFYFAGLGVGANGFERGLLAPDGSLARHWGAWLAGALGSVMLWMGLTSLTMGYTNAAPLALQIVVGASFALACASGCFFVMATCLRFGTQRSAIMDSLANNAFGIYLLHYVFVVWLQYALLGLALFAVLKGTIVFAAALLLAWASVVAMRSVPFGARLIGEEPRVTASRDQRKFPNAQSGASAG